MKYKLLVLDLDGTLTNQKKEVTEHTRRTLIEAQERGVKIVLASGRPTYGVAPLAEILELQKYEGYINVPPTIILLSSLTMENMY